MSRDVFLTFEKNMLKFPQVKDMRKLEIINIVLISLFCQHAAADGTRKNGRTPVSPC